MGKSSTHKILRGIINSLSKGSKSINEVAHETGFDRISITKYLEILKDSNILGETKAGKMRVFTLKTQLGLRDDTYFGLPLDEKKEKLIDSLYMIIRKIWLKQTKRQPVQIQVQKALYKVNKVCNLNLPIGWYLFGALCVKPYDSTFTYNDYGLRPDVMVCVKEVVEEYATDQFAYQTKLRQYEEEKKIFYLLKEEILRILYSCNFSQKSLYVINRKVKELFSMSPKNGNETYFEILNEYLDLIIGLLTNLDENKLKELQPEITGSFEDVWKLIALYNFKNDLLQGGFYTKEVLDKHFIFDITQQEREIVERCSYLQSLIPPEEEPKDPNYKKIKSILSKVKALNEEESKKTKRELNNLEKEIGVVNKKLIMEFGLD